MKFSINYFLISVVLVMITFSCNDFSTLSTDKQKHKPFTAYKDSTDELPDSSGLVDIETMYYKDFSKIHSTVYTPNVSDTFHLESGDTIVSLNAPMLYFSDTGDLFEAIKIMDLRPFDSIQAYEDDKGYTSLLTDYVIPNMSDDLGYHNNHPIHDYAVAAVENKDAAIRVGNEIWVSFYEERETYMYPVGEGSHGGGSWPSTSFQNCLYQEEASREFEYYDEDWNPNGSYGDYFRLNGWKVNTSNAYRAVLKMEITVEIWDDFYNVYALATSPQFHMRKDQWNLVKWKKPGGSYYQEADDIWVGYDSWKHKHVLRYPFARRVTFFPKSYCVPIFETTHNWIDDFWEDVHNDIWP